MVRSPEEAKVERKFRGRCVMQIDKKHRIVCNKLLMNAYPQWKGRFFWHRYKSYSIDTAMGSLILYSVFQDPVFFLLYADALTFIHAAIEQEKKGKKIGEYYYEEI